MAFKEQIVFLSNNISFSENGLIHYGRVFTLYFDAKDSLGVSESW